MMSYLVYTGNLYPHKNVSTAIAAAEELKMTLKIICARSVFQHTLPKSQYVEYMGQLTDQEVKQVYEKALAFVFPSLVEGFGLPGLEAMAAGLPVIASNSSCLPEVYGSAALYFSPLRKDELVMQIKNLQKDKKLRNELIKMGKNQIKKYSWKKMADQTWEIYEKFC